MKGLFLHVHDSREPVILIDGMSVWVAVILNPHHVSGYVPQALFSIFTFLFVTGQIAFQLTFGRWIIYRN